jgi:hypothetical protein
MSTPHASAPRVDDEPKTPLWLPALGLAFFVALAVVWATSPSTAPAASATAVPSTSGAKVPPPAPPLPPRHP